MGAARNRGTRAERIALAIARREEAAVAAVAVERARWEALTPEERTAERERAHRARMRVIELQAMTAMVVGAGI
jgi:hypothetical protein